MLLAVYYLAEYRIKSILVFVKIGSLSANLFLRSRLLPLGLIRLFLLIVLAVVDDEGSVDHFAFLLLLRRILLEVFDFGPLLLPLRLSEQKSLDLLYTEHFLSGGRATLEWMERLSCFWVSNR